MRLGWLVSARPIPKRKRCGLELYIFIFCEWLGFSRVAVLKLLDVCALLLMRKAMNLRCCSCVGWLVGECAADSETEMLRIWVIIFL